MSNLRFILISVAIFLISHLFSTFSVWLFLPNLFTVWVLVVYFYDKNRKVSPELLMGSVIFFDFWTGDWFGLFSLTWLFTFLIIFLVKKVILIDNRQRWSVLVWLLIFYYLFLFGKMVFNFMLKGNLIIPNLNLISLLTAIFCFILFTRLFYFYESHTKSSYRASMGS